MFCPTCGSSVANGTQFCPSCGTNLSQVNAQQQYAQPQYTQQQQQYAQPQYAQQQQYAQPQYTQQPYMSQPGTPAPSMKWFKFLIYFSLFASAVLSICIAILAFSGTLYAGEAELVYDVFPELETINMIYGILSIAVAAFSIYARFRLSGFHKNGPSTLLMLYGISLAVEVFYYLATFTIVSGESSTTLIPDMCRSIAISVAMLILNKKYFDNRKHLFVN